MCVVEPTKIPLSVLFLLNVHIYNLELPLGVLSIVNGSQEVADLTLMHSGVRAVLFVTSNTVGERVHNVEGRSRTRVCANPGATNHAKGGDS